MSDHTIIQNDKKHVWHHLTQHKALETADPLVFVKGKGMVVTDSKGNEYLDATSGGVWTVNLGYGRDDMVDAIADQFEHLRAEHEQRIDVTVVSAYKLDSKQKTKLGNALKKRLNREISITTQVDKSLIGGVILRAGDTVIDGSVRGRLNRLSEALTA